MKLKVWMAPDGADDMDIFVAIQKLDLAGNLVPFAFWTHFDNGPVALGWLRASHRELDERNRPSISPYLPIAESSRSKTEPLCRSRSKYGPPAPVLRLEKN